MDEFPTFKARDLDLGSGHTAYRHASLINHDLHAKFHWSRRAVDLTSSILHCKLSERQSSNLLRRAIKPCILTIQKTEKVKTVGKLPCGNTRSNSGGTFAHSCRVDAYSDSSRWWNVIVVTRATSPWAGYCLSTCLPGSAGRGTLPAEHLTSLSPTTPAATDQTGQSAGHRARSVSAGADCSTQAELSSPHHGTRPRGRSLAGWARLKHTTARTRWHHKDYQHKMSHVLLNNLQQ